MRIKHFMSLFVVAILSACGIHNKYQRTDLLFVDSLYRDMNIEMADTNTIALIPWRVYFNDSCLVEWINLGIENNSDIKVARLRTEEAEAILKASKLAVLPSASFSSQGAISSFAGEKSSKTYSVGVSADLEIDAFGSISNAKKENYAAYQAEFANEQAVRTQLISTIADYYYSLVALDRKLSVTCQTIENWEECLRVMQTMKRAGLQNEAAVAQYRANLLEANTSILSIKKQIYIQENALSSLLGISPRHIMRASLHEVNFPDTISMGVPALLLRNRPDIRQAEWKVVKAFYATNKARTAFYPTIKLSGSAGWTNSAGVALTNPGKVLFDAVVSLVQPIFSKGTNAANLKIAEVQQQEAVVAFTQKLLEAGEEVNNSIKIIQSARDAISLDKVRKENLELAVKNTQILMRNGSVNYLEVLTAQQDLLNVSLSEISNKYDEIQGFISLYHALGGGSD
ncbi:MAG: TolC family protein [Prevotella sp.]